MECHSLQTALAFDKSEEGRYNSICANVSGRLSASC